MRRGNLLVRSIDTFCSNKLRTGRFPRSLRSLGMTYKIVKSPILCHCEEHRQMRRGNLLVQSIDTFCSNKLRTGRFPRSLRSLGMTYYVALLSLRGVSAKIKEDGICT